MDIKADGWLAELFGQPVFRLDIREGEKGLSEALDRHAEEQPRAFYYTKLDCKWVDLVRQLGRMTVVDTNVNFELDRPSSLAGGFPGVSVAEIAEGDAEAVLDIAGSAYQYS